MSDEAIGFQNNQQDESQPCFIRSCGRLTTNRVVLDEGTFPCCGSHSDEALRYERGWSPDRA